MMKHEFETLVESKVTNEEYEIIETVYMDYPDNVGAAHKQLYATLYKTFGMRIFNDMYPRAKQVQELRVQISKANQEIAAL